MAPVDVLVAFAQAAAADGIELASESFDWLCEQGHVGLERVAKARRDPSLVAPVTAALELLGPIYLRLKGDLSVLRASRENLLLPVDLVHAPTGTVIQVDGSEHFTSFRLGTLELYPADVAVGSEVSRAQRIKTMMAIIGNQPVMWVEVKSILSSGPYSEPNMELWDQALQQALPSYPNMRLYNWPAVVQHSWFISDGIHYTSDGYAHRGQMIAEALAEAFPAN